LVIADILSLFLPARPGQRLPAKGVTTLEHNLEDHGH
jgi:hypothetical protein